MDWLEGLGKPSKPSRILSASTVKKSCRGSPITITEQTIIMIIIITRTASTVQTQREGREDLYSFHLQANNPGARSQKNVEEYLMRVLVHRLTCSGLIFKGRANQTERDTRASLSTIYFTEIMSHLPTSHTNPMPRSLGKILDYVVSYR